jgi:hypothetical protein
MVGMTIHIRVLNFNHVDIYTKFYKLIFTSMSLNELTFNLKKKLCKKKLSVLNVIYLVWIVANVL